MLSIEHCRQILANGAEHLSDEEIEEIRDTLHNFAFLLIDEFLAEKSS